MKKMPKQPTIREVRHLLRQPRRVRNMMPRPQHPVVVATMLLRSQFALDGATPSPSRSIASVATPPMDREEVSLTKDGNVEQNAAKVVYAQQRTAALLMARSSLKATASGSRITRCDRYLEIARQRLARRHKDGRKEALLFACILPRIKSYMLVAQHACCRICIIARLRTNYVEPVFTARLHQW